MKKVWKVCLVDDLYEVSNYGEVRNRKTGHVLASWKRGYSYYINLRVKRSIPLHYLISKHFNKHEIHQDSAINLIEDSNKSKHLQPATQSERRSNSMRKTWAKKNRKLVGVYKWNRPESLKKWRATVKVFDKLITIGYYNTRKEAYAARANKMKELGL